jgi:hypothetical protein
VSLLYLELCDLSLEDKIPFHQILQHLESPLQPYSGSESFLELESQGESEPGDYHEYRDVDGAKGELGKPLQISCQLTSDSGIARVDEKDPVG